MIVFRIFSSSAEASTGDLDANTGPGAGGAASGRGRSGGASACGRIKLAPNNSAFGIGMDV